MTKLLIGLLGAGVIATGGYAAATSVDTDPARTVSLPGATSTGDTTTAGTTTADTTTRTTDDVNDISGPCDEAEHRNDPRCTGVTTPAPAPAPGVTTTTTAPATSPARATRRSTERPALHRRSRCGDDRGGDDDRSGHGSGDGDDDRSGGDDDEDRSGSNSGKG